MYIQSLILPIFLLWNGNVLAITIPKVAVPGTVGDTSFKISAGKRANGRSSLQRRQNQTIQTVQAPWIGNDWTLPVVIGGQTIDLTMDTGSTSLWFKSTLQPDDQQSSDPVIDLSKATGWNPIKSNASNISYTGGTNVQTSIGTHTVTVGNMTASNMQIGAATDVSSWRGSGIIGFSFQSTATDGVPSFFEAIMSTLEQPIFATNFKEDSTGHVDFGAVDQTAFTAQLTTAPVTSQFSWVVPGVIASVDGKGNGSELDFLFDTGTIQTMIDSNAIATYYNKVPGAVAPAPNASTFAPWIYPCNESLPDLKLYFNNVTSGPNSVTIPGSRFANGPAGTHGSCESLLISGEKADYYSAGNAFFLHNYVVFNQQDPSISFAPQVNDTGAQRRLRRTQKDSNR